MGLSLEKKQEIVGLRLAKLQVPTNIIMAVKLATDISGSIQSLFSNGTIQETIDRVLPVAMRFDDNQSLESYAFSDKASRLSDIKPEMFGKYVKEIFLPEARKSGNLWSGTDYSEALSLIRADAVPSTTDVVKSKVGGFFGGLFGKTEEKTVVTSGKCNPPAYLMFLTDGDTSNEHLAEQHLVKMAAESIYVQFIGVGRGSTFNFLQRMADKYDHVGLVTFPDLSNTSDQAMYDTLLTEELATWIKAQ